MSSSRKRDHNETAAPRGSIYAARKMLRKSLEHQSFGVEGLRMTQFQLTNLFSRIRKMHDCIDEAFAGQPFLAGMAPNALPNIQRFNLFIEAHSRVTRLMAQAIDVWMLASGMKKEANWVPVLVQNMVEIANVKSTWPNAGVRKKAQTR